MYWWETSLNKTKQTIYIVIYISLCAHTFGIRMPQKPEMISDLKRTTIHVTTWWGTFKGQRLGTVLVAWQMDTSWAAGNGVWVIVRAAQACEWLMKLL